ncbi:hypothetical protein [Methylobacterium sp. ID0610]|uniref:hypothetical protein n=1 Tax=Methylobacterium carpenticola TaxID=3344827 RepID=UPI0036B2E16C
MLEVSPSDLRSRVGHHVRHAVINGMAVPTAEMAARGSMRPLLEQGDLADAIVDREERRYRQYSDWAEQVEDWVGELEDELVQRERQSWVGNSGLCPDDRVKQARRSRPRFHPPRNHAARPVAF